MGTISAEQIKVDPIVGDLALISRTVTDNRLIESGMTLLSTRTDILNGVSIDIENDGELFVL